MRIRSVMNEDRGGILRIIKEVGNFTEEEIRVAMELVDDALRRPGEDGEYTVFCACDGSRTLGGYICFGPIPMTDGRYDLYWIATDKHRSRQGVGKELLDAMITHLEAKKARRIYVDTSSTPPYRPARAFYEKHGFHLVSVLRDFYRDGDNKMIYVREIASRA